MEILEIACFTKQNEWQGSIKVIGRQKADELVAQILSENSPIAYCTIETKANLAKAIKE